jgi:glycosyltransferase involved in cell wall biosynthesis
MIKSNDNFVLHLSREVGLSGGGNATLSTILKMNKLGFRQALIFQHGLISNLDNLKNFCIKPTISQRFFRLAEKIIFRNYPIRIDNSQVSTGLMAMRQRRVKRIVKKLSSNHESIIVICHWVNLGFISLKTILWLSRQDKVQLYIHLHDFWMLQDLMHQPKYGFNSTVPRVPYWSLQGHPNVIQILLQKRSRKLKRMIRENATFLFSSSEVQEYFDMSIEYSSINSNLSKRVMPLSLEYLLESSESSFQDSLARNFFLMVGFHGFQDKRKGFERALAGFRASKYKFNCPLIIVCNLGGLDPIFIRDLEKENVFFFETVNHKTVLELMRMARAVILPSEFETFGLAIFEALLYSRYVGISVDTVQSTLVTNLGLSAIIQDWSQSNSWENIFEYSKDDSCARAHNHRALTAREVTVGESITSLFG